MDNSRALLGQVLGDDDLRHVSVHGIQGDLEGENFCRGTNDV